MKTSKFPLALIDLSLANLKEGEFNQRFSELRLVFDELACSIELIEDHNQLEELMLEADMLLLIGPLKKSFSEDEIARLVSFVESGKSLFYCGNGREKGTNSLNQLLRRYGLKLNPDAAKDPNSSHAGSSSYPLTRELATNFPVTKGVYEICIHEPSSIEITDFSSAKPLCYGSMTCYTEDLGGRRIAEGFPILIACSEQNSARILVVGDSEFLNDEMISLYDNRTFVKNALAWLLRRRIRKRRKARILFYPNVNLDPGYESGFSRMATDLYFLGYSLDMTSEVLEKPDAEVLIITDVPTTKAVKRTIEEFIEEGGGLIVLADRSRTQAIERLNSLLEGFGIRLMRTPVGGRGNYEVNEDHPIGRGLKSASFYKPLPMRVQGEAIGIVFYGFYGGSKPVMAASRKGRGALVVFGEDWIFRDHSYWKDHHYSLMRRAVEWLTKGAEIATMELDRRISILKNELDRLRLEVERLRLENVQLKRKINSLNGEETRVGTLKRIVKVDEDVREVIERMKRLGDFSIDTELAEAVLNACKEGVKVAYDVFDKHPKAALERVNAIYEVIKAMEAIVERRSKLILEREREREG